MAVIGDSTVELDILTDTYFELDGGKLWDNYHTVSYVVTYFDKMKKGLSKIVTGSTGFEFPLVVDSVFSSAYDRDDSTITRTATPYTASSVTGPPKAKGYDTQITGKVVFPIRNIISSAKMLRLDDIQNAGDSQKADLVKQKVDAMLAIHAENMAWQMFLTGKTDSTYDPTKKIFDGITQCCNLETNAIAAAGQPADRIQKLLNGAASYGTLAKNTTTWIPRVSTDVGVNITFSVIRDARLEAKVYNSGNKKNKPTMCILPEDQFGVLRDIAGTLIRLDTDSEAAKFGFSTVIHEGMKIDPDDFCPSQSFVLINENYWGLRLLKGGAHDRTAWKEMENSPGDMKMDMYANGNWVTPVRGAHYFHPGLAAV